MAWATGELEAVTGMPSGAETAGSLIELSGRGRAEAQPERSAAAPMKEVMKTIVEYRKDRKRAFVEERNECEPPEDCYFKSLSKRMLYGGGGLISHGAERKADYSPRVNERLTSRRSTRQKGEERERKKEAAKRKGGEEFAGSAIYSAVHSAKAMVTEIMRGDGN